eukprot:TRINITY_DN19116_c0_g1_i1.p1 TRINITY_DN19116_c0_g1~~TRINITY_DN19116_c0_g1_i1.p1  ORF type:complete len:275 (-),score=45.10 TRINITY_DN19116_c0_g1_i1:31-801(-)
MRRSVQQAALCCCRRGAAAPSRGLHQLMNRAAWRSVLADPQHIWPARHNSFVSTPPPPPTSVKDLHYDMALASTLHQWERVIELFEHARSSDLALDTTVFDLVIAAYAHEGQWELALAMLENMWDRRLNPSESTYNCVVDVLQVAGQWRKVIEMINHIKARGEEPSAMTYKAAFLGCAQAQEWKTLLELFADLKATFLAPDVQAVNIALVAYLRLGDYDQGLKLAKEFASSGNQDTLTLTARLRAQKQEKEEGNVP